MKTESDLALLPFVFSSATSLPDSMFVGYCFCGANMIVDQSGHDAFVERTGKAPGHLGDGCYAMLRRCADRLVLGNDWKGQCKLFLYRSGTRWAVSNSFYLLARTVRENGWPLTLQHWLLPGWLIAHRSFKTLFLNDTVAREIELLLPGFGIEFSDAGAQSVELPKPTAPKGGTKERLDHVIALWLSRLKTLLTHTDMHCRFEITGGIDSRTVLAFLLHLRDTGHLESWDKIEVVSGRHGEPEDYRIAVALARKFGFELNRPQSSARHRRSPRAWFDGWRYFGLGMYSASILPQASFDPRAVMIGGHGGEFLRKMKPPPVIEIAQANEDVFRNARHHKRFVAALKNARNHVCATAAIKAPADWHYHRNYRNRQHFSFLAQFNPRLSPLIGAGFQSVLETLPFEDWVSDGILLRIMQRLKPGLEEMPYDEEIKSPKAERLAQLPGLTTYQIEAGKVYGWADLVDRIASSSPEPQPEEIDLLIKEYHGARAKSGHVLSPDILAQADAEMAAATKARKFPTAKRLRQIHVVILAALVSPSPYGGRALFSKYLQSWRDKQR